MANQGIITMSDLPEAVQDFLFDSQLIEQAKKIVSDYQLDSGKTKVILEISKQTVCGWYPLETLPAVFFSELKVDWETAKKIAVDFVGRLLLPIDFFIGDVASQLTAWGADPKKFEGLVKMEVSKVSRETPQDLVKEFLADSGFQLNNEILNSRLEFLLTSFLSGARSLAETQSALMRSPKIGGLEMAEPVAIKLLEMFQQKTAKENFRPVVNQPVSTIAKVGSKPLSVVAPPKIKSEPVPLPTPVIKPAPAVIKIIKETKSVLPAEPVLSKQDDLEVGEMKKRIEEKIRPVFVLPASAKEAVEVVLKESGLVLENEDFKKRLMTAIEARFNGVRDAFETRDFLEKNLAAGGLGLSGIMLVKVVESVEKLANQIKESGEVTRQQTKSALQEKKVVQASAQENLLKQEKENLNKRYTEITGQAETKSLPPKPAQPVFSPSSITPPAGRPQMLDVVTPFRLAGPIEEVANLTLKEFRRMASDPREAVEKIKDKIDLLEEQGYGQKILGIKAWRSSPINHLYLELTREALITGVSVDQVIAIRVGQGEEVLNQQEISAINEINGQLRF